MSDNIKGLLQQAIALAQSGQRSEARELLQKILDQDPNIAVAWLWFANVAPSKADRINALQKVLQLDPTNKTARIALEKLGVAIVADEDSGTPSSPPTLEPSLSGPLLSQNEIVLIGVVVVVALIAILSVFVVREVTEEDPTSTPTNTATSTVTSTPSPTITVTPSVTNTPPPPQPTLPPTFTPTDTLTPAPTNTPRPSRTPRPSNTPTDTASPTNTPTTTPQSRIFGK